MGPGGAASGKASLPDLLPFLVLFLMFSTLFSFLISYDKDQLHLPFLVLLLMFSVQALSFQRGAVYRHQFSPDSKYLLDKVRSISMWLFAVTSFSSQFCLATWASLLVKHLLIWLPQEPKSVDWSLDWPGCSLGSFHISYLRFISSPFPLVDRRREKSFSVL